MPAQPEFEGEESYKEGFLALLNNRGKLEKGSEFAVRRNGFVALVHGSASLEPVQSLCFQQDYNTCLTARYRLRPHSIFGTLFAAFLADLQQLQRGKTDVSGELLPAVSGSGPKLDWRKLASSLPQELNVNLIQEKRGVLEEDYFKELFKFLADESILSTGIRLVLFGEVSEANEDGREWEQALTILFPQLPERFGLVLSGVPENFQLPDNNPQFLGFNLPIVTPSEVEKNYRFKPLSLQSDLPASEDWLGVNDYAEALARFILHPQTRAPLSIGIHGPWGKGKSSFMKLVDIALVKWTNINRGEPIQTLADLQLEIVQKIVEIESASEEKRATLKSEVEEKRAASEQKWQKMQQAAKKEVLTVGFNAWQFEDAKQIWAGLASTVSKRLEGALPRGSRVLLRLAYTWNKRRFEFLITLFLPVLVALWIGLYLLFSNEEDLKNFVEKSSANSDVTEQLLNLFVPTGSVLLLLWFVAWRALKVIQPVSERVLGYIQLPNYREQMGYQNQVMEDLDFTYKHLQQYWPTCKVVVFIDDLDRCSEEKIMEVLQAINLILGNSEFFVFLGMDTEMIYRAIRVHYRKNQQDEPLPPDFSESYLRKILQLSFHLPETPQKNRLAFINTLFSATAQRGVTDSQKRVEPEVSKTDKAKDGHFPFDLGLLQKLIPQQLEEVEDTKDELGAFHDFEDFLEDNPREIKRLVNIHRLVKIILQRPDTSWPPIDRQRKLVKWLIFCVKWTDLIDDVLAVVKKEPSSPNCLEELIKEKELNLPSDDAQDFGRLREFAARKEVISSEDIIGDFSLAADISQMVREPTASIN